MRLSVSKIREKWLIAPGFALEEVDRLIGDFPINYFAFVATEYRQFLRRLPFLGGHHVGEYCIGMATRRETIAVRPERPV